MFGHSSMDGKFKLFTLKNLTDSIGKDLQESYYVEQSHCITDTEYFNFGGD
jgi:hypothetical protein